MIEVVYRAQLPHGSDPNRGPGWTDLILRDGTDDKDVLHEVWVLDVYHLRGLADEMRWTLDPSIPRPRIIDLGAHAGVFAACCLQMFPDVEVMAVEPNVENFGLLQRNTAKWDRQHRCGSRRAAVGGSYGNVTMHGAGATGHAIKDGNGDTELIELAGLIDSRPVALLKIDIEGAEYAALDACPVEQIACVNRIVMEWHGPAMAPHLTVDYVGRQYGDMLHKLSYTHAVNVYGRPDAGGMLYAHRYPD